MTSSSPDKPVVFKITNFSVEQECTLIDCLDQMVAQKLSKAQLKKALSRGAVWLASDGKARRVRRAKTALKKGDLVSLYYNEQIIESEPVEAELIADEGDYSVWNKPAGMFSQPSKWGDHNSIVRYAENHFQPHRSCFLVHRLDRATSGLIIVAHSKKATATLANLFEKRQVEKSYRALVPGRCQLPEQITTEIDGKNAATKVLSQKYIELENATLVALKPLTGRKHQLRVHLAEQGFPILGDRMYGEQKDGSEQRNLCLQAYQLRLSGIKAWSSRNYELESCPFA